MSSPQHTHYDVLIIGGGMVGSALACALSHKGLSPEHKVLMVEAVAIERNNTAQQPGYDSRCTVLSAGSVQSFKSLGLWQDCVNEAEPITDIHVSDQGRFGSVKLNSQQHGVEALGYVVANTALGYAFNQSLLSNAALELCAPAQVLALKPSLEGMHITLESSDGVQEISASLVVLAEGGRSGLSAALGIHHSKQSYKQSAVIANVSFSKAHEGIAYERFTHKGPLAFLPLADHDGEHRAALVWTHAEEDIEHIMQLSDSAFLSLLQQDFGDRLGVLKRVGQRASYPLNLHLAEEQIRPGLVLLGNVAHTLHPVAGQGFNLGMRDAMLLAANIRKSLQANLDPGDFSRLTEYTAATQQDQQLTIDFSDYMTRMFSSNHQALIWARHFGMACVDMLPPLKQSLSKQAMGKAHPMATL